MLRYNAIILLVCAMMGVSNAHADDDVVDILVFGDSLVAGYGILAEEAFPSRLEVALQERGHQVRLVNAGVSGDTTGGGVARLGWSLSEDIDAVILELGANDALQGLPPQQAKENLAVMIEEIRSRGLPLLLAGMRAPPNLGRTYVEAFDSIYPALSEEYGIALYPFFLEGVALVPSLNLPDGLHPNPNGVETIVRRILPYVEKLLLEK
ncbi:MAG: arylesterase [Hyphomicrobiales bacterium]|nr:arylesterase [Hyphomicrobiales bacterium]MCY4049832.1 arylesterase [Hyphomicrobiales bacterium]MCY4052459.1 arylesterase [Hyphomicrobiales bacterium]